MCSGIKTRSTNSFLNTTGETPRIEIDNLLIHCPSVASKISIGTAKQNFALSIDLLSTLRCSNFNSRIEREGKTFFTTLSQKNCEHTDGGLNICCNQYLNFSSI